MIVDEEILSFTERTGKGGHHRVYQLEMTWSELKEYLVRIIIDKLMGECARANRMDFVANARPLLQRFNQVRGTHINTIRIKLINYCFPDFGVNQLNPLSISDIIKQGILHRKTMEISNPDIRLWLI